MAACVSGGCATQPVAGCTHDLGGPPDLATPPADLATPPADLAGATGADLAGGGGPAPDLGPTGGGASSSGCGCDVGSSRADLGSSLLLLLALAGLVRRSRSVSRQREQL